MPDFQNPAAFLLLIMIPLLFIFRKAGIFSRPSFIVTERISSGASLPEGSPLFFQRRLLSQAML